MIVIALLTMGGLSLVFAVFLAIADKFLQVEENPLILKINEALPGVNCGACGKAGCFALAEAIALGQAPVNGCPVGGADTAEEIGLLMGIDPDTAERLYPVLMCQGDASLSHSKLVDYHGPTNCISMDIVSGGEKLCLYGCLGGGDCVEVCTFNAMYLNDAGLPEVAKEICTGCQMCVKACPRNLIEMHPESKTVFVLCKNHDEPKRAKSICDKACTACNICVKNAGEAMVMDNNLAKVVDYSILDASKIPFEKCRTGAIVNFAPAKAVMALEAKAAE